MNLAVVLRGGREAVIDVLSDAVISLAAVSTSLLLAERFDGIGQWTINQIYFMLGYTLLVSALLDSVFGYNILSISRRIGRGHIDHMLLQPRPMWMLTLSEGFDPLGRPLSLLLAVGFLTWSSLHLPIALTPAWVALLVVNLLASAVVVFSFQLLWGSLAFWAPRSAEEVNASTGRMVKEIGTLPMDGLSTPLTVGLLTVVPIGFTAWFPSRELAGLHPITLGAALTPLAAAVFLLVSICVFRKGLLHYATVGSQRYSSFGHRR
jgi:ABC-2 type transport system permease protein